MNEPEPSDGLSIAIVGVALRFPGAGDADAFWQNLRDGVESITFFDDDELDDNVLAAAMAGDPNFVKAAAVIDGEDLFDAGFFEFNPREAEITDPQQRVLLESAWLALENAGYEPESFDGAIGVFAGVGLNAYFLNNVIGHPEIFRSTPPLQIMIGTDKDYVAPRLSYKLDLRGPSVSVQTACSTSLVAVHLACQSLQDYQCDMALAGGCSIRVPQRSGYWYQEGGILSADGRCRPFDDAAGGTVAGSGAGMVVLKRLEDARAGGDRVLAVIRGSAINNDGSAKAGFTAPSVEGQVAVISEALAAAGVDSGSIGYVEAHGTGTPLGDPIEVSALAQAFAGAEGADAAPGSCALGSVKSNIGHLDTAAGVAGLIKTVLALRHRQIPPSLHFEIPNAGIDFDSTPFRVNAELSDWPAPGGGGPRRAGVSSFGIGGSNAHAVLEEAPTPEPSGPSRDQQLLLLSARTANSLESMTDELARHLGDHPEDDFADVAYTRQVGRKRFEHRRFVVCRDREDAAAALRARDGERVRTLVRESKDRPVAFLLSGQGAQYPGMGRGLYEGEPTFRQHLDQAAEILAPALGCDLRQVLYPASEAGAADRLRDTALAQPALFAVEYALARLWMEWGVTPRAMLGHSIGEYVAACLAEVLSLEDALALVAARGRLMQSVPPGAMLSVPLSGLDTAQLLSDELSLAAINGPTFHVVSGTEAAVAAAAEELAGRGIEARRLHTSHAFHSAMMDPILDRFAAQVRKVRLAAPRIPFLSNLTGTWIRDQEATDPDYWVRHLRQTVRFSDGLAELLEEPEQILLEVGPGRTLATLSRRHDRRASAQTVLTSIRHPGDAEPDRAFLLDALGRLWLEGVKIDWQGFARHEHRRRCPLPGYPFERQRYWLDARPPRQAPAAPSPDRSAASAAPPAATAAVAPPPAAGAITASAGAHPRPDLATDYVAPRGDTEQAVAAIWGEALSLAELGVYDDFFELGGHSLLATQIGSRVREVFHTDVALGDLFAQPTIAGMAAAIDERLASGEALTAPAQLPTLRPLPEARHQPFPLTDVQQAYWIGRNSAFELGGVATHVYNEAEVRGIDLGAMTGAWRRLIDHHDMLRAVVRPDGRQQILEEVPPYEIEVADLRRHSPEEVARALEDVRQEMSQQVLPADRWPLFEIRASQLEDDLYRLHLSFDLLIGDAWSWMLLTREFQRLYHDRSAQLKPLSLSFRDYVLAVEDLEQSPAFERDFGYWRDRLADFPAAPELPLAVRPSTLGKPRFIRFAKILSRRRWQRLKERATRAGLTPSGILLAAFAEVLGGWSKDPRFAINLTLFNRLPLHPEVNELIGDFTSLTLLAVDTTAPGPFLDRARRLQTQLWEDLDHRLVSAVRVLRELARVHGTPARAMMPVVFTSTLNMASPDAVDGAADADDAADEEGYGISQTPQVWIDHQVTETRGALYYNWDVVEDLFPAGLLETMFAAYGRLIGRLADLDETWEEELPELLPATELAPRAAANETSGAIADTLLHQRFAERARLQGSRPAVICDHRTVSYDELARRSHALAVRLRELGARPDRLVAVAMRKGWEQVVAVLAVLEAGAAYLPIDPQLPDQRRFYLIENGEAEIALTQSELLDGLAWPPGLELLAVDRVDPVAGDFEPLEPLQSPSDLAYVIFTSGSTGHPKGVMIDHRSAGNTIDDVNQRFEVGPDDRVLAVSALHFDLSVYDVFGILAVGGAIVLPPSDGDRDPALWSRQMVAHQVTIWNSVPALMELLVDFADGDAAALPEALRLVMLSGDWIPVALPDRVRELRPAARVVSLGGATEASIWSILHPIEGSSREEATPDGASIPYGKPMRNQSFQVLDHRLEPRPVWVPGQLFIGGAGLARGYWRDPDKTAASFITHPRTGERLYRTGDLGRYLPDASIQFLGREDFQVKIRGYRIELGEIEAALTDHPGVRETVVAVHRGSAGEQQLVAYLIAAGAAPPAAEELKAHLLERLPAYMVPAFFTPLASWPLTPNGKVDRGALPAPGEAGAEPAREYVAPATEIETVLAEICAEILGRERIGIHDDFFELGGDSLMATRLIFQIRKEFEVELPVRSFFDAPTVAQLAERVEETILAEIEELPEDEVHELL